MDKFAVLTGGSGRAGPFLKDQLENMGYDVAVLDLPDFDVSDRNSVLEFKYKLKRTPSVLVNNAAIDNPPGTKATFFGSLERILQVNLMGPCYMSEAIIPMMVEAGGGVIVNIGSIMGNIGADWKNYPEGFEKPVAYNLSKAGLIQLSRSITTQYGRFNVRSVTIAFGPLDIGLPQSFKDKFLKNVPLGRAMSEESWRSALRFAVECPELAGQQVLVDGGYTSF